MLVLSRKAGETIRIGDDVVVQIKQIKGRQASVGIIAPRQTAIVRGELGGGKDADQHYGQALDAGIYTDPPATDQVPDV